MTANDGFNMGSMPQAQTTQAGPAIQPQRPPASPAMFPAAVPPPQPHGQRPPGQAAMPQAPAPPPVAAPQPMPVPMPVMGAMPAFPQQFQPVPAPMDAFHNRLAMILQTRGHPGGYAKGPTIDPRIRAEMDGLPR